MKEKGKITNKEYQLLTTASKPTASRDLKELTDKLVFEKHGRTGKGTIYTVKGS